MKVRKPNPLGSFRLLRLENRIAPAGVNSLITRAEPSLIADSGANDSYVAYDPVQSAGITAASRHVSDNGRYVVLESNSPNLISGQIDTNGDYDIFLYDRIADATVLVSHKAGAPTASGNARS